MDWIAWLWRSSRHSARLMSVILADAITASVGAAPKIAARLVDDSAMRVGHFASRRVVSLVLDALVEDLGVAEAHHDVVWLEVGVNDMAFNVHVGQALE